MCVAANYFIVESILGVAVVSGEYAPGGELSVLPSLYSIVVSDLMLALSSGF